MRKALAMILISVLCLSALSMLAQQAKANSLSPVGYWKFDEGFGTIAHDSSGNGNDGTVFGASWTNGIYAEALQFDGIDDYVGIPDSPTIKASGNEISVELWFRPAITLNSNTNALEILDKGNEYTFILNLAPYQPVPNGKIAFLLNFEGIGRSWVETTVDQWLADTWYHLAGVYDGNHLLIYVNGMLQNSVDVTGTLHSESYPLAVGSYTLGTQWSFNGAIDEVKIYNYARTAEECEVDVKPDTLNLRSMGKWITVYIELPEGFDATNIDVSSILLNNTVATSLSAPVTIGDYDNDGLLDLMVKFDRASVVSLIVSSEDMAQLTEQRFVAVTLTITGNLNDGTPFSGSDTVKIVYTMPRYGRYTQ